MMCPFLAFLIRGSTLLMTLTTEKKLVSNCSRMRDLVRDVWDSSSIVPTSATAFSPAGQTKTPRTFTPTQYEHVDSSKELYHFGNRRLRLARAA
jgi:hypothetical protein